MKIRIAAALAAAALLGILGAGIASATPGMTHDGITKMTHD